MNMAPDSHEGQNIARQLHRELRLRTTDDTGIVSSGCSSPATPATPSGSSSLTQKLQTVYHQTRKASSPRTPESKKKVRFQPQLPSTSEVGPLAARVSPSRTASSTSDSSTCGGSAGSGYISPDSNSKEAERSISPLGSQDLNLTVAPPGDTKGGASSSQMDSKHCIGDAKDSPSGEGQVVKPDPVTMAGGANKGAGGCAAGVANTAPPKRKRKRKSKKPPTILIELSAPSEFRAKVQELTGMKPPPPPNVIDLPDTGNMRRHQHSHSGPSVEVVRPHPKRPGATEIVGPGVDIPSAALMDIDPSSASEPLTVTGGKPSFLQAPVPGPAVYQGPSHIASHPAHADSGSYSSHSELNATFGYEASGFGFMGPQHWLFMSMQDPDEDHLQVDPSASESLGPCDCTKAADSRINMSTRSSNVPCIPPADSFNCLAYGQPLLCDIANDFPSAILEDAEGDQDEATKAYVDTWICFRDPATNIL